MKKTFLAILFAASLLSLASCKMGKKSEQASDSTAVEMQQAADESAAAADSVAAQDSTLHQ